MKIKSNLDEMLYDRIIEQLISGRYAAGQKLTLDELAQTFEVSRTPVVQAVKRLSGDGVLQVYSNGRIYVPDFDPETIRQICETRRLIEGYALERFMSGQGMKEESILPQLRLYAEQCERFWVEENRVAFATADRKLHRTLVQASGNSVLLELYTRGQGRFTVANYMSRPLSRRDFQGTLADHTALLQAISERDMERAIGLLHNHIDRAFLAVSKEP